jgi:hypothetical protein
MNLTEKICLTVSFGIRYFFATCSICSSIDVVKSSLFDANLNLFLPVGYSDVSSQPESNLNIEKKILERKNKTINRILPFWCIHYLFI